MTKKQCGGQLLMSIVLFSSIGIVPLYGIKSESEKKQEAYQRMVAFSEEQRLFDEDVMPGQIAESEEKVNLWFGRQDGQSPRKPLKKHSSLRELSPLDENVEIIRTRVESFSVPLSGVVTSTLPGTVSDEEDKNLRHLSLQVKILGDQVFKLKNAVEESSFAALDSISQRGPNLSEQVAELGNQLSLLYSHFSTQFQAQQKTITELTIQLEKIYSKCGSIERSDKASSEQEISAPLKRTSWWKRFVGCCGTGEDDVRERVENEVVIGSQSSSSEKS